MESNWFVMREFLCMYVAFHSCPSFPWIILMALFVFVSIQNLMQGFPNTESCSIFVASSSYSRLHRFEGKTFQIFRLRDIWTFYVLALSLVFNCRHRHNNRYIYSCLRRLCPRYCHMSQYFGFNRKWKHSNSLSSKCHRQFEIVSRQTLNASLLRIESFVSINYDIISPKLIENQIL